MNYVLVTGAAGGMGKAAVAAFCAAGYGVFALDRTPIAPADGVIALTADITDEVSLAAAAAVVRGVTDSLFAIVHYAGIYMLDSLV